MKEMTLVVLAAGLGSRYGGLKQLDALGPSGETIMEYSVYDAIRSGFEKIVFVTSGELEHAFGETWKPRLHKRAAMEVVVQDANDLPGGFSVPPGRVRPWGTAHAVLAARKEVNSPFAVINADDFYGREAYRLIREFLITEAGENRYCMAGYRLGKTLSGYGGVSRGLCEIIQEHELSGVTEIKNIEIAGGLPAWRQEDGTLKMLDSQRIVSMNIWGFKPGIFEHLEKGFREFLAVKKGSLTAEYLLPGVINGLLASGQATVKVLQAGFEWFGITYRNDKPGAVGRIRQMVERGTYPVSLWNR
jgi:dTDP-glucose pyrophosphorylase